MFPTTPAVVFRLVLLALLTPFYVRLLQTTRPAPGRRLLVAAFFAIAFSFIASLFDAGPAASYGEALKHLSIGVAGVLSLLAVLRVKGMLSLGRGRA